MHRASAAEPKDQIEAERSGTPFVVLRDADDRQRIVTLSGDRATVGRAHPSGVRSVQVNVVRRGGKRCLSYRGRSFRRESCAKAGRRFVKAKVKGTRWSLTIRGLKPGTHTIRIRATDAAGNASRPRRILQRKLG
ncbi:MAG: hypothetical protein H0V57_05765 [Thermoleophilaceae bacterium]|nr:hypothetical protein [Thermoleophilaceae bacterium]